MSTSLLTRVDQGVRNAVPSLVTCLFLVISVVPLRIPLFGPVSPLLALACLYYWGVHRPDLMPLLVVFMVGILHDILIGATLGAHAVVYLVSYWLLVSQRRFLSGRNYLILWWGFLLTAMIAVALEWLVFSTLEQHLMPVEPLFFRVLLTAALFPLVGWIMIQLHRFVVPQPRLA
ncbi:MAG: rod shape-determining protein MreD [Azospirillaceae bacterium]